MDFKPIATDMFYGRRYRNLQAAVEDLDENEQNIDIVVIPPEPDYHTDEDEIDEDDIRADTLPFDVPGAVEMFSNVDTGSDEEDNIPLSMLRRCHNLGEPPVKKRGVENREPQWTEDIVDISMNEGTGYIDRQDKIKKEIETLNPVEIFEKLFDEEVIEHLRVETQRYASQHNNHSFSVSKNDMKIFIGILLFSGYHHIPREKLYWCVDEDLSVPLVRECMSRNRYYEIKKYFHVANNEEIDKNDKMYKLRPLMDTLNKKFSQWGIFHDKLSIDEAMVKYFGHHSSKQFIRGKPVRFGYKDWMICSSTGYCYRFDTYCGAKQNIDKITKESLPLGSRVVLDLLSVVEEPKDHIIFFDNYFTSHDLMKTLRQSGYRATGTVRDNRIKKCPLPDQKQMKKENRGHYSFKYDKENSLLLVRWKDNSIVTMMTNYDSVQPLAKVKRWSKERKEKIDVPQPHLFASYNSAMGGVDLLDQSVNNYRVSIQGKKWWWPLWTHMLNVAVVNAWRLHLLAGGTEDLLNFIRNIARHYMRVFEKAAHSRHSSTVPNSIVQSEGGHFPKKIEKQLRCRKCHLRSRWACIKCNATLCLERDCFIEYHTL